MFCIHFGGQSGLLWSIDLYERGFIEKEDIDFIQAWVQHFDASFMAF